MKHKRRRDDDSPHDSDSKVRHRKRHEEIKQEPSDDESDSRHRSKHRWMEEESGHRDEKRPKKKHSRHQDSRYSDEESEKRKKHSSRRQASSQDGSDSEDDRKSRRHKKHRSHRDRDHAEFDPNLRIKQERDERNFDRQERERSIQDQRRRENHRARERGGGDFGMNSNSSRDGPVKFERGEELGSVKEEAPKEEPNMGLSGKLTEDTNTFRGVVIKYNEPEEAMVPKRKWRLYPFKGEESLGVLHIHRQSAYLMGRDRKICEIALDHPSSSKQHAVLQYRAVPYTRPDGSAGRRVRPYIIDLESANGTFLNGEKIEAKKYVELREKDVMKFAFSTREYVILHDKVDTSELGNGDDFEED